MKKLFALLLTLVMVLSLVACGGSSSDSAPAGDSAEGGDTAEEEVYELRMVHSFLETTLHGRYATFFEEKTEELTGGRVQVTVYPNAQMGQSANEVTLMLSGTVDAQFTNTYIIEAFEPAEAVYTLPFLFDLSSTETAELLASVSNEKVDKILGELYAEKGVLRLGSFPTLVGQPMLSNNTRPIKTLEDFNGLKIRHPGGLTGELYLTSLGCSPITVASSEVPVALQQNIVDGMIAGAAHIYDSGWDVKYMTLPYFSTCSCPLFISMDWWNKLPEDLQNIIQNEVVPALNDYVLEVLDEKTAEATETLQQPPYNMEIYTMPEEEVNRIAEETGLRDKAIEAYLEVAGPRGQEIIDAILEAQ